MDNQNYLPSSFHGRPAIPVPDLAGVNFDQLSAWQRRVVLASQGWTTSTRLSKNGGGTDYHLSLWARHWHWHGTLCEVILHVHKNVGPEPWADVNAANAHMEWQSCILFDRAMKAWGEFTECVPCQINDGLLVENTMQTERFSIYPKTTSGGGYVVQPERSLPTESLPGWPNSGRMSDFLASDVNRGQTMMEEMVRLASLGVDWNCSLDTFGRHSSGRGHLDRRWALASKIMLSHWNELRLDVGKSNGLWSETSNLSSYGAAHLVAGIRETVEFWRREYGPNQGIPPGCVLHVQPEISQPDPIAPTPATPGDW